MRVDVDSSRAAEGFRKATPHGSINSETSPSFEAQLQPLLEPATRYLLLDFRDVEFVSSAGLQVLFAARKTLVARGGDLLFCGLQPQIVKLFNVVRALPEEGIFASLEEADRYFYAIQEKEIRRARGEDVDAS
jgi:anti-anti-sigma factor